MWACGAGQLHSSAQGRGGRLHLGTPPGRRTQQCGPLEGGLFPRSQGSDQSRPTVTQGPYLSLARLGCADPVADADVYTQTLKHT